MTKDEALKLALEALETGGWNKTTAAITALRERLAQPEQTVSMDEYKRLQELVASQGIRLMEYESQPEQEPVAWLLEGINVVEVERQPYHDGPEWTPLYTTPPQRKPLTDEQIMANDVLRYHFALNGGDGPISKQGRKVIDAIEAAHGIKENT